MKSLLLTILFLILAIVVAAAIALGAANLGVDRTEVDNHTVYGSVREVVVKPGRGTVEVVPSDKLIRIRETQHYIIEKPSLEQTRGDGVLTIEPKCDDYPDVVPCFSNLRVSVPASVKVTVHGGRGNVELRGVDVSGAHVETGSGDIELGGLTGKPGLLWAHTDSGDVEIVAGSARAVDAQTSSGDVDADIAAKPRKVLTRSNSGDVELTLPRGIYAVKARSASGDVSVRGVLRNADARSSIDARTDSGDLEVRTR